MSKRSADALSNFAAIRLKLEYVDREAMTCPNRELRKHSKIQIRQLADGIERTGFLVPLVVDEQLGLGTGQARLAAAAFLKLQILDDRPGNSNRSDSERLPITDHYRLICALV